MKIGIDIDEVLCDVNQSMLDYQNVTYSTSYKKEDIRSYFLEELFGYSATEMITFMEDFFATHVHEEALTVLGAVEGIEKLKGHELIVISARPQHQREVTELWLSKHFGPAFSQIHLLGNKDGLGGVTRSKGELAEELELELFVEDSLSNAMNISAKGIPVILLDTPWNQGILPENVYRVATWEKAMEKIQTLTSI